MSYEAALSVQQLKALGRKQGFLTFAQMKEHLPGSVVDPKEIESIVAELGRAGVRFVAKQPDDPDAPVEVAPNKPKPPLPLSQEEEPPK